MKLTRPIAGLVTAGLLGVTPLAVSTPAQAANDTITTTTVIDVSSSKTTYGGDVYINGNVTGIRASTGTAAPVYDGTVTLYEFTTKNPGGRVVGVDPTAGYFSFYDIKPAANAVYRAVYTGYTAPSTNDVYTPSQSADSAVGVARKVKAKLLRKALKVKFTIKPDFNRKKLKVLIKKGKKYKKFKKVKTNKKGKATVKFPAPRRGKTLYFKVVVPGNKDYLSVSEKYYTRTYRQTAQRVVR